MSHTRSKAHTTSKGVFMFFQHYASYVDLEDGKQPKTKKEILYWMESVYQPFGTQYDIPSVNICFFPLINFTLISIHTLIN